MHDAVYYIHHRCEAFVISVLFLVIARRVASAHRWRNSRPVARSRRAQISAFKPSDLWPPNSPNLNHVDLFV